jgi:hypothetical protein
MSNLRPNSVIDRNSKQIYVYNLKEILTTSDEFNPTIVFKKQNSIIKSNDELVKVHRYLTGNYFFIKIIIIIIIFLKLLY